MSESAPQGPTRLRPLYGGRLALDFANTVEPRLAEPRRDNMRGYVDLVRWASHAGAVDDATAVRLLQTAATHEEAARRSFHTAITFREAIYRTFAAIAAGITPHQADLGNLRQAYAEAMRHARLLPSPGQLSWTWERDALDRVWWPVARSAIELATQGPLDRVKQCPGPSGCGFLFLDTSKNRTRRWCSMDECGNEVKAKRQTARRRAVRFSDRPAVPRG